MPFVKQFELPWERRILKAGESATLIFDTRQIPGLLVDGFRVKLRLRGDVQIHPSWMYEGGLPFLYRDIDDALTAQTHHSRYALELSAQGESWPRRAYFKIQCPPKINTQYPVPRGGGAWRFSCWVWTENLRLAENGRAAVIFEHFLKKDGVDIRDISGEPEETVVLPFPTGTCGWRQISCEIPLGDDSAAMLVTIALEHAWGKVRVEDPRLENGLGFNILPPVDMANRYLECFNWYGENLSQKEWTTLCLTVNGKQLPEYPLFQRCFRGSENELELPDGVLRDGENLIEICNVSHYNDPLPYCVEKAELLTERRSPVRIAWCPRDVAANREFGVLLKTYTPQVRVRSWGDTCLEAPGELLCREPGLHVLRVRAGDPCTGQSLTVQAQGYTETVQVQRIVEKEEDNVLAGSGDAIYVPQDVGQMEDFLIWYLENGLGNMITFRPVYRWSGTRECNEAVWRRMAKLCDGLGLHWCHIIDGRELPGLNANPTKAMLAGKGFLGNQAHERDGALYYWLQRKGHASDTLFEELSHRVLRHPDFPTYHPKVEYDGENTYFCFSPTAPRDMREAAEQFVGKARAVLSGVKRHTGPSVLFKYFFQAGLEVGGAELMYGPLEVVLAALRGASTAYGRKEFAAHLAVQWGTTPHDTLERYRRYRLALLVSYLNGVNHINTEEGLYRMEEFFAVLDRFSVPCREHGAVERQFVHFLNTHTRRGKLHRGVALLHGAYDGWACFCRRNAWAQEGVEWEFAAPEESWDLIRVFYPDSVLDAIYRHPCPAAPQGYYTRTPYGLVDILPVEAQSNVMRQYGAMAFLGWNTADAGQISRLTEYVRAGGTLVLGWPHLFTDTRRRDAIYGTPHPLDAWELIGVRLLGFREPAAPGSPTLGCVSLGENTRILREKDGLPLVIENRLGSGTVYFVNAREYPASAGVREVYEELLRLLGQQEARHQAQKGCLSSADTVETAVYDREDGHRVVYAINTDWYSREKEEAQAVLRLDGQEYPVPILRDRIHCFTIRDGAAVETADWDTEVLSLEREQNQIRLTLQGGGEAVLRLYFGGSVVQRCVRLNGITHICFPTTGIGL